MATRKKKVSADDAAPIGEVKPTARQVHKVVTHFERNIPIEEAEEITGAGADDELDLESIDLEPEEEFIDEVEAFLDQHGIRADSDHTWSMVVERLPDYERNRINSVQARRKSCGERPFNPDFEEDIRREFARPGLANDFRVTIKRDGKFFRNWPHVISLEPPPPAVIHEEESKRNAVNGLVPQMPYPAAAPITMDHLIKQARQFYELQKIFAGPAGILPTPAARQLDDEDTALLSLLKISPELTNKLQSKLVGKILNGAGAGVEPEPSTARIIELALENGPAIIDRILQGIGVMRGQPLPAVEQSQVAPDSSSMALASVVTFAHAGMTPDYVCDWLIDRSETDESLTRFIDSIAAMDPPTLLRLMAQVKPELKQFIESEQMGAFVNRLIEYLNSTDEQEGQAPA